MGYKMEITIYQRMEHVKEEKKHQAGIGDISGGCEKMGGEHLTKKLEARWEGGIQIKTRRKWGNESSTYFREEQATQKK